MSDLVGNHIVGFPTRRLKCYSVLVSSCMVDLHPLCTMVGIFWCKGLVTHKRKSLDVDFGLIEKNSFCLFYLLLYVPVDSYGHVGMIVVERGISIYQTNKNSFP